MVQMNPRAWGGGNDTVLPHIHEKGEQFGSFDNFYGATPFIIIHILLFLIGFSRYKPSIHCWVAP